MGWKHQRSGKNVHRNRSHILHMCLEPKKNVRIAFFWEATRDPAVEVNQTRESFIRCGGKQLKNWGSTRVSIDANLRLCEKSEIWRYIAQSDLTEHLLGVSSCGMCQRRVCLVSRRSKWLGSSGSLRICADSIWFFLDLRFSTHGALGQTDASLCLLFCFTMPTMLHLSFRFFRYWSIVVMKDDETPFLCISSWTIVEPGWSSRFVHHLLFSCCFSIRWVNSAWLKWSVRPCQSWSPMSCHLGRQWGASAHSYSIVKDPRHWWKLVGGFCVLSGGWLESVTSQRVGFSSRVRWFSWT